MVDLVPGIVLGSIAAAGFLGFLIWVSWASFGCRAAAAKRGVAGAQPAAYGLQHATRRPACPAVLRALAAEGGHQEGTAG